MSKKSEKIDISAPNVDLIDMFYKHGFFPDKNGDAIKLDFSVKIYRKHSVIYGIFGIGKKGPAIYFDSTSKKYVCSLEECHKLGVLEKGVFPKLPIVYDATTGEEILPSYTQVKAMIDYYP